MQEITEAEFNSFVRQNTDREKLLLKYVDTLYKKEGK